MWGWVGVVDVDVGVGVGVGGVRWGLCVVCGVCVEGGGGEGEVVVVVRTDESTHEFILARQWMHLIMGAVSLWTRPPALYLCTRP